MFYSLGIDYVAALATPLPYLKVCTTTYWANIYSLHLKSTLLLGSINDVPSFMFILLFMLTTLLE
jgi:hypothetical protein